MVCWKYWEILEPCQQEDSVGFSAHLRSSYLGFCQLVLLRVWTSHGASNSLMSPNSFHILYKLVVGGMCGVCLSKPGLDK